MPGWVGRAPGGVGGEPGLAEGELGWTGGAPDSEVGRAIGAAYVGTGGVAACAGVFAGAGGPACGAAVWWGAGGFGNGSCMAERRTASRGSVRRARSVATVVPTELPMPPALFRRFGHA